MAIQGLEFIPFFWVAWTSVGVIITLTMAIIKGHIDSFMPFISDTGMHHPESTAFTVVFSISAVLGAWTVYVVYKRMTLRSVDEDSSSPVVQKILLLVGWMMCLGMMILANCQSDCYPGWHLGGTVLALGLGAVYNISQALCLYRITSGSTHISRLRAVLCVAAILTLLTLIACKIFTYMCSTGHSTTVRIVSACGEWTVAITLMLSILTYMPELQHLCMKCPSKIHEDWIHLREMVHAGPEYP